STVTVAIAPGSYASGTRYTFLAANSITGAFSGAVLSQPGFAVDLGYENILIGGVSYFSAYFDLLVLQSSFASIAETPNQLGVANYLDVASLNATPGLQLVTDELSTLPVSEQQYALETMTAQVNGTMAQLQVQDTTFLYSMLRRRVGSGFGASGLAGEGL